MISYKTFKRLNESFAHFGPMSLGFGRNGFAENPLVGGQHGVPFDPNDPNAQPDPNDPNAQLDPNDPNAKPDPNDPNDPNAQPDPEGDGVAPPEGGDDDHELDLDDGGSLGGPNDPDAPTDADDTAPGDAGPGAGQPAPGADPAAGPPADPNAQPGSPDVALDTDPNAPPPEDPNDPNAQHMCSACKKKMGKNMKGESKKSTRRNVKNESAEEKSWWASVNGQINAPINPKFDNGLPKMMEDKLLAPSGESQQTYHRDDNEEPRPGEAGFAPQGRIGSIGSFAEWSRKKGKLIKS